MSDHTHTPCLFVKKTWFGRRHTTKCGYCDEPMDNIGETAEIRKPGNVTPMVMVALLFAAFVLFGIAATRIDQTQNQREAAIDRAVAAQATSANR